jgi:hypothetical protein
MPICHKNKFIFFHIPRCGGTSFERIFDFRKQEQLYGVIDSREHIVTLHHLTPTDLRKSGLVNDEILQSYFKFTIIRDPFDRMASDYLWQQVFDAHNQFAGISFDEYLQFAEQVINEGLYFKKKHYDHFRPMIMYCAHDEELLVDDILLLENIDSEVQRIKHKLGGDITLPKTNSSSNYEYLRTDANLDKVYQLYAADKALYDSVASL